jgi:hypothetical protein
MREFPSIKFDVLVIRNKVSDKLLTWSLGIGLTTIVILSIALVLLFK